MSFVYKNVLFSLIVLFLAAFLVLYWIARKTDVNDTFVIPDQYFQYTPNDSNYVYADVFITIAVVFAILIIIRNLCKKKFKIKKGRKEYCLTLSELDLFGQTYSLVDYL
jgi:preprotein translocase subunit SecG